MKKISVLILLTLTFNLTPANAVDTLPQPFFNYLSSKYLADPGIILLDGATKEIVYQNGADILRSPASVLKLTSAVAVAMTLDT